MVSKPTVGSLGASAPTLVGRHEILLPIAAGGMATVYLARALGAHGFERLVALKLLHSHLLAEGQDSWKRSLITEAKLAARLRHPNVVPVLDIGESESGVFLVMDYVEGDALSALMWGTEPPPPSIAARILCDALAGLHAAHELADDAGQSLEVVHRDFSPHNVLVGIDGVSRLTDFGIARAADRLDSTRTGLMKGKIPYMSPEQVRSEPLDRRSDVWAAGVVAWELFSGRRLFARTSDPVAIVLRICTESAPKLRVERAGIPDALDAAIAWALTQDRDRRCPTAAALRKAVLEACSTQIRIADAAEVGAYVERVTRAKLAERHARVDAIKKSRSQPPMAPPKPSTNDLMNQPLDPSNATAATAIINPSLNRHRSDSDRRRSGALVAGGALVALAFGAAIVAWASRRGAAPEQKTSANDNAALAAPTPSASDNAARAEPTQSASAAASSQPTQLKLEGAARSRARPKSSTPAAPRSSSVPMATNPYGKKP